ncbi:phosphoglycerate kinase [Patescibacteria group bacterium]
MLYKKLPKLKKKDIYGKKIIARVDFNVPFNKGKIVDDFKIRKTLPLIKMLKHEAKSVVFITHISDTQKYKSFKPFIPALKKACGINMVFAKNPQEARKLSKNSKSPILLENLRVFLGEKKNDIKFAKLLSSMGDIYINEDFAESHRAYSSIIQMPKLMPSFAGLLFAEEVKKLEELFNPKHPMLLIIGGVKFKSKVGTLERFIKKADKIFIGGGLANTFLLAFGNSVGMSKIDKKSILQIKKNYSKSRKILLPEDVIVQGQKIKCISEIKKNDVIYDAGPKTVKKLIDLSKKSKMIVWNGPIGYSEYGYEKGTKSLALALSRINAKVIIGGGDTVAVVRGFVNEKKFHHVSTGGGAMLEFLSRGTLPGIEALLKNKK